jgi:Spy/CpxP family protein refolding chaperone
MKKKITSPVSMALAAVFLAALLVLPAAAQAPGDQGDDRPMPRMRMAARDILDLTPEQEKKLEAFREARIEESRAFRDQMMKMRGELDELMKDPAANEAKINAAIDRMSNLHAGRLKASVKSRAAWESDFHPRTARENEQLSGGFHGPARNDGTRRDGRGADGLQRARPVHGSGHGPLA